MGLGLWRKTAKEVIKTFLYPSLVTIVLDRTQPRRGGKTLSFNLNLRDPAPVLVGDRL